MKKILFILLFVILSTSFIFPQNVVFAETSTNEDELSESISEQLENLDLSDVEKIINNLSDEQKAIFKNQTFYSKIFSLLKGEYESNGNGFVSNILTIFFDDLLNILPFMALIIAIAIIFSMVSSTKPNSKSKSIGNIIHFVCYGLIIVIVLRYCLQIVDLTKTTIGTIKAQMEAIFPLLLTMLTATGGTASVAVYQPAFAFLTSVMITIFSKILLPIFIFTLVFNILSNLTDTVKFEKFSNFFSSAFKCILGLAFTVFLAFSSIQGITAGSYDGISIKAAKYTIKSSIPFIGGYLSDGFNMIMASSMLIKNSIGGSAFLLLFASVALPILSLILFSFSLKLVSAILEPLTDKRISSFISSTSKSISLLIALLVAITFMYLILVGLVMTTANFV